MAARIQILVKITFFVLIEICNVISAGTSNSLGANVSTNNLGEIIYLVMHCWYLVLKTELPMFYQPVFQCQ